MLPRHGERSTAVHGPPGRGECRVRAWGRADPAAWGGLDLRAHALLAGIPLHDVWRVELPGGGDRGLRDLLPLMTTERTSSLGAPVRALFALRRNLGRLLGWDPGRSGAPADSSLVRLDATDRARSWIEPGTRDGPFTVLYAFEREALSEIRNATVHAFSAMALEPTDTGSRLFWAIYVEPVGRITPLYMALIDPFRRAVVYPAILRHLHSTWRARFG